MDVLFSTLLCGVLAFVVWKLVTMVTKYVTLYKMYMKIPQKPSHWLFGHALQLTNSREYLDYCMDMMRSGSKIHCAWVGPFPVLGVTHPETFKQLIQQTNNKPLDMIAGYRLLKPWIGDGLLLSSDRKWARNRRLLTPAFHFGILSNYTAIMNEVAETFIEKLATVSASQAGQSVDIFPYVCRETLDAILRCSLSHDADMQGDQDTEYLRNVTKISEIVWKRMLNPILAVDWIYNLTPLGREQKRICKQLHEFTGKLIQDRRETLAKSSDASADKKRLDFLDILLTAKDDDGHGLSDQDIQNEVDTFTFEGHDTTASGLSWAIYSLSQDQAIQQKVYEDVTKTLGDETHISMENIHEFKYLPAFVREAMRFWSPVPMIARMPEKTITVDGYEVPPGNRVDIQILSIHHNPEVWDEPEVFKPERFDQEHKADTEVYGWVPFSAGSRNCIGQVFANNEIKIVLAKLVRRFEVLPDPDHKPCMVPDIVTRSTNGIRVILKERKSS